MITTAAESAQQGLQEIKTADLDAAIDAMDINDSEAESSVTEERNMTISVVTLNGNHSNMMANINDTIYTLKSRIRTQHEIPIDQQCLFFNEELLNHHRTLQSYKITSGSKLKLILHSYQRYKMDQERITYTTTNSGCNSAKQLLQNTQHLEQMLIKSQNRAKNTATLSTLNSMEPQLYSEITNQISNILYIVESFRKETEEAKTMINVNLQNKVFDCVRGKVRCRKEIAELDAEIDAMNQQIAELQNKRYELDQVKQTKQSFHDDHYVVYKDLSVATRNENIADVNVAKADVERTYNLCIQDIHKKQYETKIKEMLCNKVMLFEKEHETWNTPNMIEWIKTIEDRYFDHYRFDPFFYVLENMEPYGRELKEINSTFFLITAGVKEEKDQCILRKHINRIVNNNVCILCITNMINTAIIPCGHCCWCYECAQKQKTNIYLCPICRRPMQMMQKIFMPGIENT